MLYGWLAYELGDHARGSVGKQIHYAQQSEGFEAAWTLVKTFLGGSARHGGFASGVRRRAAINEGLLSVVRGARERVADDSMSWSTHAGLRPMLRQAHCHGRRRSSRHLSVCARASKAIGSMDPEMPMVDQHALDIAHGAKTTCT